jgi:hypothetical protein
MAQIFKLYGIDSKYSPRSVEWWRDMSPGHCRDSDKAFQDLLAKLLPELHNKSRRMAYTPTHWSPMHETLMKVNIVVHNPHDQHIFHTRRNFCCPTHSECLLEFLHAWLTSCLRSQRCWHGLDGYPNLKFFDIWLHDCGIPRPSGSCRPQFRWIFLQLEVPYHCLRQEQFRRIISSLMTCCGGHAASDVKC